MLLRSEENFARGRQYQNLERMSAESEEHVTQEKDAGGAVADSVMGGEDEDAARLLMGVTTPKVKNRTFRFVAKTYRLYEANRNIFMQCKKTGFPSSGGSLQ
jgi:hypothetical protein